MNFNIECSSLRSAFPRISPNVGNSPFQTYLYTGESRSTSNKRDSGSLNWITFLDNHRQKHVAKKSWLLLSKVISHPLLFSLPIIPMKEKSKVIKYLGNHNIIHRLFLALMCKPRIVMLKYLSYVILSSLKENCQICSHESLHIKYVNLLDGLCMFQDFEKGNLSWKWLNTFQACEPRGSCEKSNMRSFKYGENI